MTSLEKVTCRHCLAANPAGQRFCGECGQPLGIGTAAPDAYTPPHLAQMILGSRSALEGERKQVTVLFCDLAGSTTLAEALGADVMHQVLERFFALALAEVHRLEGTVNQFLGDGLMALFGAPVAREDHARRAVLAAIGIQRAIEQHHAEFHGADLKLRIGMNTGSVVVGKIGDNLRMDYTAVGDTTNLASRIQGLAEPGWVYATAGTQQLVVDAFDWEPLGERHVKGRVEPVMVFRTASVHRAGEPRGSAATGTSHLAVRAPLIGRDAELAIINEAIEDARTTCAGRILALIGEPGLGKSRLLEEAHRAADPDAVLWLEGRSLSFGQTLSYWPFLDLLRRWLQVTEETPATETYEALRSRLTSAVGDEVDDLLPYLAVMLGLPVEERLEDRVRFLDGQAMGLQIFRSARRLVERLAEDRVVVLVFEDLHWADASTTDLLGHLLPLTASVPLVLIGTSRPDRSTAAARLAEATAAGHAERFREIRLRPLADDAGAALVRHLLDGPAADDLRRRVIARAEGNPYFAEEVVRSLITSGAVVRDESGWRVTDRSWEASIPGTIQGVIGARVDRLDDDVKQVLKIASVIGRSFLYRVLNALDAADTALDDHLAGLKELELIRERRKQPELEFLFTHALVQEATYDSILLDRRRKLHLDVATAIEALFPDRLDEFAGVLAHHYTAAEEWERAQHYLFRAGDQAGRMAGDTEALARYRQALDAYAKAYGDRWDPKDRAVLERKVGEAVFGRGDFETATDHFRRALVLLGAPHPAKAQLRRRTGTELLRQMVRHPLGRRIGSYRPGPVDPVLEERCRLYYLLGWMDLFRDQEQLTYDVLIQLNIAEQGAGPTYVVRGAMSVGIIFDILGQPKVARRYLDWARRLAEEIDHPVARADAATGLAWHHIYAGRLDEGYAAGQESARHYASAGQIHNWGGAIGGPLHIERYSGHLDRMRVDATKVLRAGDDAGDAMLRGWGNQALAFAARLAGDLDVATEQVEAALAIYRPVPSYGSIAEATADLAACRLAQDRIDDAIDLYRESVAILEAHRLRNFEVAAPRTGLAEALLVRAERSSDAAARAADLDEAGRSAAAARTHAKAFRVGLPNAARVSGVERWLRGDHAGARTWWTRGLESAQSMGARYDEARIQTDIGRLTGDDAARQAGEGIMREIVASWRQGA